MKIKSFRFLILIACIITVFSKTTPSGDSRVAAEPESQRTEQDSLNISNSSTSLL